MSEDLLKEFELLRSRNQELIRKYRKYWIPMLMLANLSVFLFLALEMWLTAFLVWFMVAPEYRTVLKHIVCSFVDKQQHHKDS